MGFVKWFCRCIPAFSILLWIFVTYQALGGRIPGPFSKTAEGGQAVAYDWQRLSYWQLMYIFYAVLSHLFACLLFPGRLVWAIWHISDEIKSAKFEALECVPYAESEGDVDDKSSQTSLSGKTLSVSDGSLSRVGTPKGDHFPDDDEVIHAIILPSYKEDMDTMRETISVLASHSLAKTNYDLYLAMEQRDPDAESTANALIQSFGPSFRNLSFTLHPGDISGEVAGKSSNVSWAARQLSHNYVDTQSRGNCIITVMDSDTHLQNNFFLLLTKYHRENRPESASTLYVAPIIFDRNAHSVNPLVRAADIFWCGAGLSGLYRTSPCSPPTSVYSIAMTLAGQVGGWDTGPDSIGEDLHMFLKCYFATAGQFHTKIVYCPVSQCNVASESKGWRGEVENVQARYKQAMRHMWGSLDSGYAVHRYLEVMWKKNDEKLSSWLSRASDPADRVPQWVNDSNLTHFTPPNLYEDLNPRASFSKFNLLVTFHRLYEAHFLPSHLTIALFSGVIYASFVPPAVTHPLLLWSFGFNGMLRFIGFCLLNVYIFRYETYHKVCVRSREEEMKRAGLYDQMIGGFSHRTWKKNWIDYTCLPITGTLFGTIPGAFAELCHLFTDKLVYTVSLKPQLNRTADKGIALA